MLELGNQHITEPCIPERTGSAYYANRCASHTSVDLNGLDGAVELDLAKVVTIPGWTGYYDIITNAGTTEHVEPKTGQYCCFRNIHEWLRTGGIAVHIVPDAHELESKGCWKGHCNNYYSIEFFEMLAASNSYKLVLSDIRDGMIWVCLQKVEDVPFMDDRKTFLKHIARRLGGVVYWNIRAKQGDNIDYVLRYCVRAGRLLVSDPRYCASRLWKCLFKRSK
jgi:hypothetical protein